ncbi:MAG: TonB-dependent receptor [Colwellia sp.]|nr:TonB-dependent receptor [Colwellia sp.]
MIKTSHLTLTAAAISTALSFTVFANPDVSSVDQTLDLETITVTATRTERRLMDSPLSSSVITNEEIAMSSAASLADLLRDVPGVEITDAATAGMKRIKIRGESSRRVAVLIDGQELTDHSTYGAPLLLDPAMVERIEVIRGTGSVLYGQKALGGVVNFITKKGGDEPIQASFSTSFDSATKGRQFNASAFGAVEGFDYRLSWSDSEHDNRMTPEGELDETAFANDSIMAYGAYNFGEQTLGLTYDQYNMNSEIATGIPGFKLDMPQRDREKVAAFYTVENVSNLLTKVQVDVYQQTVDREFVQHMEMYGMPARPPMTADMVVDTQINEQLYTLGFNGQFDFILGDAHYVIAGLQYTKDEVDKNTYNQTQMTMHMPAKPGMPAMPPMVRDNEEANIEQASLTTQALYVQDEWQVSNDWLVTLGARHYWVDSELITSTRGLETGKSDDSELVGSLATNYSLGEDQSIRALVSQGYGYPTLLQTAMGATAAGSYINPNPELEAERSVNYELGYRFRDGNIVVDATAFYTDSDEYLTTISCSETEFECINPIKDDIYINADKATSKGLELDAAVDFAHLNVYTSITWSERETTMGDFTTDNTGLPSLYGRAGVKFFGEGIVGNYWFDAYLRAASDAQEQESATDKIRNSAGWGTVNLAFSTRFGQDDMMLLSFEALNITDKKYSTASEGLLAAGQSIQAKLSVQF